MTTLDSIFAGRPDVAVDPVCGMRVDTKNPGGGTWEHEGETYYFCGPGCNSAFQEDPQGYISGEKKMSM